MIKYDKKSDIKIISNKQELFRFFSFLKWKNMWICDTRHTYFKVKYGIIMLFMIFLLSNIAPPQIDAFIIRCKIRGYIFSLGDIT